MLQEKTSAHALYAKTGWGTQPKPGVGWFVGYVVTNSETFAEEKGYDTVSRKSIDEQMQALGMDLEEMLAMV